MNWKTNTNFKIILLSLCTTLSTSLIQHTLVGATRYGFPFAWLVKAVVVPDVNPWSILPLWLCLDYVFWYVTYWVVFLMLVYMSVVFKMYSTGDI